MEIEIQKINVNSIYMVKLMLQRRCNYDTLSITDNYSNYFSKWDEKNWYRVYLNGILVTLINQVQLKSWSDYHIVFNVMAINDLWYNGFFFFLVNGGKRVRCFLFFSFLFYFFLIFIFDQWWDESKTKSN